MKARAVIAVVLSSLILTSCSTVSVPNESESETEESSVKTSVTSQKSEEYYDIDPKCNPCNFFYDVRDYQISDIDVLYKDYATVTADELKEYAYEKLDSIESANETSVRGYYQDYGFEIIRADKFTEWKAYYGFNGFSPDNSSISYDLPIADGGAMTESQYYGILLDPSERFFIVHYCYDYKILYEFFNGKISTDGQEAPPRAELSEDAQEIYDYFNVQEPFYCTAFLTYDITGDGQDEYCYTISGGAGFYRSVVMICDPVTEMSYMYYSLDFDYSIDVIDDQLILSVAKGENCKEDLFPDQGKTETLVMDGNEITFLSGNINGNCVYTANYKEWNLFKS